MNKNNITRRLTILSESIATSFGIISMNSPGTVVMSGNGSENRTCGKCNSLLVKKLDKRNFWKNTALKCNNCGSYNDLNKYIDYKGTPVVLKDISDQVENIIEFTYGGLSLESNIPYTIERNNLSDYLYDKWINEHFHMPGVLYQYTSFFGVTGMLSNHSIWMTDVAYMNDSSEMQYGMNLINDYISIKKDLVSEECKALLNRVSIPASAFTSERGYLIACFCANNDLLSQWRAYGSGGSGYNVGFDSRELCKAKNVQIRKVIYGTDKQQSYIKITIDSICTLFESVKGNLSIENLDENSILPAFAAMLSAQLNEFLFTFKHSAFSEEDEWRIIRSYEPTDDLNRIKFRQHNSVPVPYMELSHEDMNHEIPLLPIVQVTHGPALHPQLTKKSLTLIMRQNGYSHAEIKGSTTPLRL